MIINTEMIAECLQKKYNTKLSNGERECRIYSAQMYDGDNIKEHHIYVIESVSQISLLNLPDHVAFVCSGVTDNRSLDSECEVITIEEKVETVTLLNELIDILDNYNKWEQQLYQCRYDYDGLKEIITLGSRMMRGELLLTDANFNWIVSTDHFKQYTKDSHGKNVRGAYDIITEELLKDPEFYAVGTKKDIFVYDHNEEALCCNLFRQGENRYYGRLIFMCRTLPYTRSQVYLLRYLANMVDKIFSQMSTFSLPVSTYSNLKHVMKKLLNDDKQSENLVQSVLHELRWKTDDTYVLLQFMPAFGEDMNIHLAICSRLESLYAESCAIVYGESVLLLVNITQNGGREKFHVRSKLAEFLRENMYKAGISKFFNNIQDVKFAYLQAKAALHIGSIKHKTYWYFYFDDYVMDYVVTTCEKELPLQYLVHDSLMILKEHDSTHKTEYIKTLHTFLLNNHNMKQTADTLYIHRTTLQSRLERIKQLTNLDLNDWTVRLHLMLSFYMKMK